MQLDQKVSLLCGWGIGPLGHDESLALKELFNSGVSLIDLDYGFDHGSGVKNDLPIIWQDRDPHQQGGHKRNSHSDDQTKQIETSPHEIGVD